VHENDGLSPVNHLHSLLEGPSNKVIQGLPLTETNYDTAVDLLKERFGKPKVIIAAQMDELVKLPDCSSRSPRLIEVIRLLSTFED